MTRAARKPKADKTLIDQQAADQLNRKRSKAAAQLTGSLLLAANLQTSLLGGEALKRSDLSLTDMFKALADRSTKVIDGDLSSLERRLAVQANSLDMLFNLLADRAAMNMGSRLDAVEKYLKLAFKAQAQCRSTVEAIHLMHNPTQIIKQTNIAQGHQQVVNGTQGGGGKIESAQSKLLAAEPHSITAEVLAHDLDSRKAAATV
jgi:hypothetical protein